MTTIEWTDETWNPTVGCTRVSPGCDRCYAITSSRIRSANPHPAIAAAHAGATEVRDGRLDWTGQVNVVADRLDKPLTWRKPRRVFVDSLSDLFHSRIPDEFVARVFAVMARTPQHTYQLLTKRHGRMRTLLGNDGQTLLEATCDEETATALYDAGWPLPNVWLGVSVEDQQRAELRVPALLDTPAAVRFLSCEPLLGALDLGTAACASCRGYQWVDDENWSPPYLEHWRGERSPGEGRIPCGACSEGDWTTDDALHLGLDWVIAGGESGSGSRPMHPDWPRALRDQCALAGVPFFFKQWGDWAPTGRLGLGSVDPSRSLIVGPFDGEYGEGHEIARLGKKAAGRELDGRTHDDFPLLEEIARA